MTTNVILSILRTLLAQPGSLSGITVITLNNEYTEHCHRIES